MPDSLRPMSSSLRSRPGVARRLALAAALLLFCGVSGFAYLPVGEEVVSGEASFQRSADGQSLHIATSNRAIINWKDFSIGPGRLTQFEQAGHDPAVLNRVVTGNPSSLHGTLLANGRVYLINPNGILVGPGGMVDTGGFVASTLDLSNGDFLAGGDLSFGGDSAAGIVNLGRIETTQGDVFLLARQVINRGELSAAGGTVGIAAGNAILLKEEGQERLFIQPTLESVAVEGIGVENAGFIEAVSAIVKAKGNGYALAINSQGAIAATGTTLPFHVAVPRAARTPECRSRTSVMMTPRTWVGP